MMEAREAPDIFHSFPTFRALEDLTRKATTEWRSSFFTRLQISVSAGFSRERRPQISASKAAL